jgi:hypothetical protein
MSPLLFVFPLVRLLVEGGQKLSKSNKAAFEIPIYCIVYLYLYSAIGTPLAYRGFKRDIRDDIESSWDAQQEGTKRNEY